MTPSPVRLMTVDEFRQIPEPTGNFAYELHHGELVPVTRLRLKDAVLQSKLRDLLRALAPPQSYVEYEVAFRAEPEYELREADVAYLSAKRWAEADAEDSVRGAPDLVLEILSPSNTVSEMYEKEQLCLTNGCAEFWVLDPEKRTVRVAPANGRAVTYRLGQQIPLPLFGDTLIPVDSLFA